MLNLELIYSFNKSLGVPEEKTIISPEKPQPIQAEKPLPKTATAVQPGIKKPGKKSVADTKAVSKKTLKPKKGHQKNKLKGLAFLIFFLLLAMINFAISLLLKKELGQIAEIKKNLALQKRLENEDFSGEVLRNIEILDKIFLEESEVIDLITRINSYSVDFDELVINFENDVPQIDKILPYLPFILKISGPTKQVNSLVEKILNANFLVSVNNISTESKDSFINQTKMTINADLYVSDPFN